MTSFSENVVTYEGTQLNVVRPPDAVMGNGLIPATASKKGMSLPANWLNWLFREIFRLINRDVFSDETGAGLFVTENAAIELVAVDKDDVSKYIHAVGWKATNTVPSLHVISSSGLSLGTGTAAGDQPIIGGTSVATIGKSRS